MRIGVGSTNPVKVAAVLAGVKFVLEKRGESAEHIQVQGYKAASGVSDQPFSDVETRQGAQNRAQAVLQHFPEVEVAFGLEGGVMEIDGKLHSVVWICVADRSGKRQELSGNRFALPDYIEQGLRTGAELGDVMDTIEGKTNTKHGQGMFGFLTEGVVPRQESYEYLVRFVFALWMSERMEKVTFPAL